MEDVNWADMTRKVQRRLATACWGSTTVEDRVEILNVEGLPPLMFTSTAFQLPNGQRRNMSTKYFCTLMQRQLEDTR
ncbi:hypothetical protein PHMEG_00021261 [Phytophthora megakarya]|uniref:Uncharacterized protein n=1 Tax=Phytophthora megakarya TaxID=4795 RepID=A0A225VNK1_9STRA|nr:hypothetical protein PHMEG_00021261 [Phytophthora megakarya]